MNRHLIIVLSITIIIILNLMLYILYFFNYIPHRKYSNEDFNITNYYSKIDKDSDGIDDQSDILLGVKYYLKTKPKYKSKYYQTGYSNDEYGVCTDVVANGLLNAGYDLMKLVNEDIKRNLKQYDIKKIDINIDFRRVKNLIIFFNNNAIKLTDDIYDYASWQGGDIVIFSNHIAIVSEHRNKNGVNFIYHNASNMQRYYEEDVLEHRKDIVGHYRIS